MNSSAQGVLKLPSSSCLFPLPLPPPSLSSVAGGLEEGHAAQRLSWHRTQPLPSAPFGPRAALKPCAGPASKDADCWLGQVCKGLIFGFKGTVRARASERWFF